MALKLQENQQFIKCRTVVMEYHLDTIFCQDVVYRL